MLILFSAYKKCGKVQFLIAIAVVILILIGGIFLYIRKIGQKQGKILEGKGIVIYIKKKVFGIEFPQKKTINLADSFEKVISILGEPERQSLTPIKDNRTNITLYAGAVYYYSKGIHIEFENNKVASIRLHAGVKDLIKPEKVWAAFKGKTSKNAGVNDSIEHIRKIYGKPTKNLPESMWGSRFIPGYLKYDSLGIGFRYFSSKSKDKKAGVYSIVIYEKKDKSKQ